MNYIGIDLGGTNIKGALVSAKGEILKEHSIPTRVGIECSFKISPFALTSAPLMFVPPRSMPI